VRRRSFVVDVPAGHDGPVDVELRRGGQLAATLTLPMAPAGPPREGADGAPPVVAGREQEIVEAACDVIAAKGFAATSMRDIAAAAGVPIATMYRYIGSKDELLARITATRMQELFDHFEANLNCGGTATDRLAEAIEVYVAYISKNHRYINLVYRETKALDAVARERIYETERRFMQLWAAIIADGVEGGELAVDDVDLAANLAYFSCTVWALRHWSIGDRSQADVAAMLVQMVVGGLARRDASAGTVGG
jgi:AcrR family transcriptional regulator